MAGDQKLDRFIVQQDLDPAAVARVTAAFRTLFDGHRRAPRAVARRDRPVPPAGRDRDERRRHPHPGVRERRSTAWGSATTNWWARTSRRGGPMSVTYRGRVNDGHAHVFEIDGVIEDSIVPLPGVRGPRRRRRLVRDRRRPHGDARRRAGGRHQPDAAGVGHRRLRSVDGGPGRGGHVISANTTARAALGVDRGTADLVAAFAALDPIREDERPFTADELPPEIVRRNQVAQTDVVMGLRSADGDRRWMNVTSTPVQLDGQRTVVTSFADRITGNLTVDAAARQRRAVPPARRGGADRHLHHRRPRRPCST